MNGDVLSMLIPRFTAVAGIVLLAGVLPLFASFVLEGIAHLIVRRGQKLFLVATFATLSVAALGFGAMWWGTNYGSQMSDTTASDIAIARMFLVFSIPVSLGMLVVRLARAAAQRPKRRRSRPT
jgi:TRAP-type C4-dicarboxylate transport system permease small subunit